MLPTVIKRFPVLGALFTVLAVTVPHRADAERFPHDLCASAEEGKRACGRATGSRDLSADSVDLSRASGGTLAGVSAAALAADRTLAGSEGSPGLEDLEGSASGGGGCISVDMGQNTPL